MSRLSKAVRSVSLFVKKRQSINCSKLGGRSLPRIARLCDGILAQPRPGLSDSRSTGRAKMYFQPV